MAETKTSYTSRPDVLARNSSVNASYDYISHIIVRSTIQRFSDWYFAEEQDDESLIDDQRTWSIKKCATVFCEAVKQLATRAKQEQDILVWDKVTTKLYRPATSMIALDEFFILYRMTKLLWIS